MLGSAGARHYSTGINVAVTLVAGDVPLQFIRSPPPQPPLYVSVRARWAPPQQLPTWRDGCFVTQWPYITTQRDKVSITLTSLAHML